MKYHLNTCRFCGKSNFKRHKYPLIKYGPRHHAHPDCMLAKLGAAAFDRFTPYQLERLPFFAIQESGLETEFRAALALRHYNGPREETI